MIIATILSILLSLSVSSEACKTSYEFGEKIVCVDPCNSDQIHFDSSGRQVCLIYGEGKICPKESVDYFDRDPICVLNNDNEPCPKESIYSSFESGPMCLDECVSVAFIDNEPKCMNCLQKDIYFNSAKVPLCLECQTVKYFNNNPICLDCSERNVSFDEKDGMPYCNESSSATECLSKVYDSNGNERCMQCTEDKVFYYKDEPMCLDVGGPNCKEVIYVLEFPTCVPCEGTDVFYYGIVPLCLPIGTPACLTVKYQDNYPVCMPCKEKHVFFDNGEPKCFNEGGPGCLTVRYVGGVPTCFDCSADKIFTVDDKPQCFDLGDEDCKTVKYVDQNAKCFECEDPEVKDGEFKC